MLARVLATWPCVCVQSVCLYVTSRCSIETDGRIDLVFGEEGGLLPFRRGAVFWTTMDGLGQQVHVHHVSGRITYGGSGRAGSREDWPVRGQLWVGWWRIQSRPKKSLKSLKKSLKTVSVWQSYKQERDCFVHPSRLLALCWPSAQVHETVAFLLVTLVDIHRF